jgi:ribosome-associated protein
VVEKKITTLQKARLLAFAAGNKKALEPAILDVRDQTSVADYFVIVSGRTEVQVNAIHQEIERVCTEHKLRLHRVEGLNSGTWIVMDFGDVMVHLFRQSERDYYQLETLWQQARRVALPKL